MFYKLIHVHEKMCFSKAVEKYFFSFFWTRPFEGLLITLKYLKWHHFGNVLKATKLHKIRIYC